jgi:hypothetical protein
LGLDRAAVVVPDEQAAARQRRAVAVVAARHTLIKATPILLWLVHSLRTPASPSISTMNSKHAEDEHLKARDNSELRSQLPPGIYTVSGHGLPAVTCLPGSATGRLGTSSATILATR